MPPHPSICRNNTFIWYPYIYTSFQNLEFTLAPPWKSFRLSVVCVCVCVCERERERERFKASVITLLQKQSEWDRNKLFCWKHGWYEGTQELYFLQIQIINQIPQCSSHNKNTALKEVGCACNFFVWNKTKNSTKLVVRCWEWWN